MAAPTYSAGTYGNVINGVSVAHSTNIAALVDLTTKLGGALLCKILTAATAITAPVTFSCYRITAALAGTPNTTLTSGYSAGVTSIAVASVTGISKNSKIFLWSPGASPPVGEIVTVSNIASLVLTVNATVNAYSSADYVFLIEQTPTGGVVAPGSSWVAATEYSASIYPPPAWLWCVQASNGDGAQPATVTINLDTNPAFA